MNISSDRLSWICSAQAAIGLGVILAGTLALGAETSVTEAQSTAGPDLIAAGLVITSAAAIPGAAAEIRRDQEHQQLVDQIRQQLRGSL